MKNQSSIIGFWASLLSLLSFVVFTICFFIIIFTQNPVEWTNIHDYFRALQKQERIFVTIAQSCMVLFAIIYLIILHSLNNLGSNKVKIFSRISLSFGTIFTALISMNYFIQITSIRFSINEQITNGIEQFIMFNPNSVILSITILGFGIFFGLSSLFIIPAITGGGINKAIRIIFLLNGISNLIGVIGYYIQNPMIINFSLNYAMGIIVPILSILLMIYFYKVNNN